MSVTLALAAAPPFSIAALVTEHLASSSQEDPHRVADEVLDAIPDEHLRDALSQILGHYVVAQARRVRRPAPAGPRRVGAGRAAAVACYSGLLARRYKIGRDWRFLGDCGPDDLTVAAQVRLDLSEAISHEAVRLLELAGRLLPGQTVADLPIDVVKEILG